MKHVRIVAAVLLALWAFLPAARANVLITGTRVVFPAKPGEVTVRLSNQGTRPALVESWIDDGDPRATPDTADTPFLITPPLFRMEPQRDQSLRIIFTQAPLPTDRESLFWLNVLEVPPKPTGPQVEGRNYLQLAIRSRLKLFYRPDGLGDPAQAPEQLTFRAVADGGAVALTVHNPTPFYITLTGIKLQVDGADVTGDPGMVAPHADLRVPLAGLHQVPVPDTGVAFETINDYGALVPHRASLAR